MCIRDRLNADNSLNCYLHDLRVAGSMSVQEQVYELVKVHRNFEIRKYPDVIWAIATMSESDYSGSSESFRRIDKYIFGQNDRSMKIAMTSPVQRWNDEDGSKMAFIMPLEYQIEDLPSPTDEGVEIVEVPECLTAVLRFSGFSGRRKTESRAKRLEALIKDCLLYTSPRPRDS